AHVIAPFGSAAQRSARPSPLTSARASASRSRGIVTAAANQTCSGARTACGMTSETVPPSRERQQETPSSRGMHASARRAPARAAEARLLAGQFRGRRPAEISGVLDDGARRERAEAKDRRGEDVAILLERGDERLGEVERVARSDVADAIMQKHDPAPRILDL